MNTIVNKTGYRGVQLNLQGTRYHVYVYSHGHRIHLGTFDTPEEAAQIHDDAVLMIHGNKAIFSDDHKRKLTRRQEQVCRLCSPDFYGLSYKLAGIVMGITEDAIYRLFKRAKHNCPELFPLHKRKKLQKFEDWMSNEIKVKV